MQKVFLQLPVELQNIDTISFSHELDKFTELGLRQRQVGLVLEQCINFVWDLSFLLMLLFIGFFTILAMFIFVFQ